MSGKIIDWNDATVHVSAHTLHLGSGVFEAMRCYMTERGPAVFRMREHLERLYSSAVVHNMKIPFSLKELGVAVCDTVRRNKLTDCYVRLLSYYGPGGLKIHPSGCPVEVVIMALPFKPYAGPAAAETGVRVFISSWVKFHSRMIPTTAKACGQYVNSILALREAMDQGYDEAILLDHEGSIAEGSGQNVFIVRDGSLITNDEASSILLGITRDSVIRIAGTLGYKVRITKLRPEDLFSAEEAFLTGTAVEVTPRSE